MSSEVLKSVDSQKHKNLNISRTKQYFFFKWKNSLITHQGLLCDKKKFCSGGNFKIKILTSAHRKTKKKPKENKSRSYKQQVLGQEKIEKDFY